MRILVAVLALAGLLLAARPACAQPWTKPTKIETGLLVATELVIAADMLQTLTIIREGREEQNPILGRHPSPFRAVTTIGLGMIATGALWYALPTPWRDLVVIEIFAMESVQVWSNASIGIGIRI